MSLTEKRIRDAKPGPKTRILWDEKVKGLGFRLTPAGAGAFVLDYHAAGKRRRATLGRASEMTLAQARDRAGRELVAIRDGESDPLQRRQDIREAPTVADGLDRFFGEFVPRRKADGRISALTIRDYEGQARRTVRPALGSMRIRDVTRHDVERAVDGLGPVARNRTLAFISRLFNAFEDWEWREPNRNPARRIEKAREEPRDRVLSPSEIQVLGAALADCPDPIAAAAIRFLMVTGWRSGEALALRWEHVDFETGAILLPSTKAGRDRRPVGAFALDVLASLPRVNDNPHVFVGASGGALTYPALRRRFQAACDTAGIAEAKIHDIRRTVATSAAASGVSVFMLRDLLNHKTVAMANRYARRAGPALQETQDAVASRMLALLDGESGDVPDLDAERARRRA